MFNSHHRINFIVFPVVMFCLVCLVSTSVFASPLDNRDCPPTLHWKACLELMPPVYGAEAGEVGLAAAPADSPPVLFLEPYANTKVGSFPQVLAAADFTGDGRAEATVGTARYADPANDERLHVFAGPDQPLTRLQRQVGIPNPESIVAADLNHDGSSDLAIAGDGGIRFYSGIVSPTAPLSMPLTLALPERPDALASGDFSGDLRPDLAAVLPREGSIRLWRSGLAGPQPVTEHLPFPTAGYDALVSGDFNSDGYDDLAGLRGAGTDPARVVVFLQGAGTFPISYTLTPEVGIYQAHSLAVGDLNSDGRDDLVVTAGGEAPQAYLNVFLQTPGSDGYVLSSTPVVYPAVHLPSAVAVADLNHDGREDVIVTHDGWPVISVYTQAADGALDPFRVAPVPTSSRFRPHALAVADLTHDGGLDVALAGYYYDLTTLANMAGAPTAKIVSPVQYANVPHGVRTISGTTSPGTIKVEVRVRGLTGWLPATLTGTSWSVDVELPAAARSWWVEARATDGAGRVQAPPARHRVWVSGRVRDGLVAEYHFDERSGATLHDRSGIGAPLDLTLADEQAVSRVPEGYFVHTPARIASPEPAAKVIDALQGTGEFTLEAWVRTANLTQDGPARIMTLSKDSPNLNFSLVQSRFDGGPARVGLRLNTSAPPPGKHWHELRSELPLTTDLTHLMVTRSPDGTVIFYVNGVEQGRGQAPGDFSSWDTDYKLLFTNDALAERPWLGEHHLAAIYQRALSAAEVGQNYAAGPIGDGSPAQLTDAQVVYTFDEGSGDTVGDSALVLPALPARIADPAATTWGSDSLEVNAATIIASDGPATKVSRASMATGEITVEAWVAPANTTQDGPARIVTISQDISQRNVTLGQGLWGHQPSDLYLARLRSTTTSGNGEPHLNAAPGSLTPALTHVVYTRDSAGQARLFINGEEQASRAVGGDLSNWHAGYRLALANEFSMNRAWLGSYHFVAIYSRALTGDTVAARYLAGPEGDGERPTTTVGPFVQRVTVAGGAPLTTDRQVTLAVEARLPEGRTLGRVTVAEYGFDAGRKAWSLLQRAVLPAAGDQYAWELAPGSGVRYLQVWVTDSTGTVSSYPYQALINLAPAAAELDRGEVAVYRVALDAGQTLTASVTAAHGDADLYVWGPTGDAAMRWVSNGRGSSDEVRFAAPLSGLYQIEVHGHTDATYQLSLNESLSLATSTKAAIDAALADQADDKTLFDAPAVSVDSAPTYAALTGWRLYLPALYR